ncbi:WD40 repeat-like protein [Dacryopinax primogenitus]|uniref:Pre-mRNA-processing factor 19 n=1 Tax=Dacryopinax primogenitus (strain DJM 731) TaxID=1858805 RepID=M5G2I7_DACPD|nr:WD40 repeat-like protein [Dacryopinax primogenitus]EJT97977.1 WD40 repeat-like protein [Dacryopinax primogenitus]
MSFFCAISGEPPQNPVISPKSGLVYERRLIVAQLNQHGTEPNGEALNEDDLIPVKASPNAAPPRPPALTSVPALLHTLQSEWDSLMLETASLRQQYIATRQELAHALYQSDAATRVVARLVRERDEAREALANVRAATGMAVPAPAEAAEDVEMSATAEPEALPEDIQQVIDSTHATLSASRKKRKTPAVPSPARFAPAPSSAFPAQGGNSTAFTLAPGISSTAYLTGSEDGAVRVWDNGEVLASLSGHTTRITALASATRAEGPAYIVSGSADGSIRLWSASAPFAQQAWSQIHGGAITGLALHPSGELLLSSSADGAFSLLRLPSLDQVFLTRPNPSGEGFSSLALHPDGVLLALGLSSTAKIQIYDLRTRALAAEFVLPEGGSVPSLSFSENGYSLASCAKGVQEIVVWDLRKLAIQKQLPASGPVRSVAYDVEGAFLGAVEEEGTVEAWAHKGWVKIWQGQATGETIKWAKDSVWVSGEEGVSTWQPEESFVVV